MAYRSLAVTVQDGVALVKFTRPDKLNALTFDTYRDIPEVARDLEADPRVRAVVLTGEGRGFCSGGDVDDIIGALLKMDTAKLLEFTHMTGEATKAVLRLKKPVVAGVNGVTAGAGAVLAIACDVRVAAESARFAFLFTKVGLAGADMGAAYILPRLVGMGRAIEILHTGDIIAARDAERIGLVNRVVPDDQVRETSVAFAKKLAQAPPLAFAITKQALHMEATMGLDAAIEYEAQIQALCMTTADFHEGYNAFKEKRATRFTGQ
ncbi:MAG: enoyl-CoA hydratase family protein [Chloroflexi bacterium]|nr:enoyl-CoA hydratase family protein [Chloroflexota bacterium]